MMFTCSLGRMKRLIWAILLKMGNKLPVKWFRLITIARKRVVTVLISFLALFMIYIFTTVSLPRGNYPYNSYVGYPLSIYDRPYNIKINRTFAPCSSKNGIIVIHSKVTNFIKRTSIRKSWANRALMSRFGFKVVFFLGMPFDDDLQSLVNEESSEFEDIVQGSFYDSYINMTHKAVLVFRWITEFCSEPSLVVKVDDDVFVNVFRLYHSILPTVKSETFKAWCEVKPAFSQIIRRTKGVKYRIADYEFKGFSRYPMPSCRGYFVIITQDSVRAIYEAAKRMPFFWIDDIHLYGTLAEAAGVELLQIKDNLEAEYETQAIKCFESRDDICDLLSVLVGSPKSLETLWNSAVEQTNRYKKKLIRK